jgi:hypothetical protein
MQRISSPGTAVAAAAVIFGILADVLLRATPWGINVMLAFAAFAGALTGAAHIAGIRLAGGGRWFLLPAGAFAALFAVRDTAVLSVFNFAALLCCLAIVIYRSTQGRVLVAAVREYVFGLIAGAAAALAGAFPLLVTHIHWRNIRWQARGGVAWRATFGALLAAPLLLIFGALFAAADAGFEAALRRIFDFDIDTLITRTFVTAVWIWIAGGALWLALLRTAPEPATPDTGPRSFAFLGIVESGVVLGLLNVLFATFVISQVRYFFGGAALVLDTADRSNTLTFAEYARRGFFELVTVASLLLVVLFVGNALTRQSLPAHARVFRALSLALIALVMVIVASGLHRMWIYTQIYGLTELRLYSSAFMIFIALVLGWFGASALCGQPERFAFGIAMSACATLLTLNLINPIALIVSTNIDRLATNIPNSTAAQTETRNRYAKSDLDASYLARLISDNPDAIPPLIQRFNALDKDNQCLVAAAMVAYYKSTIEAQDAELLSKNPNARRPTDWRTFNLARETARNWLTDDWRRHFERVACMDRF